MKVFILLKARLKANLVTKSYLKDLYERDRLWVLPIAGIGILAAAATFIVMLYQNYLAIFSIGQNIGQPEILFLFTGIMSGLLIFLFGTPLCLSNIFYSRDNKLTAFLPVSRDQIILSRMLLVYLFLLPVNLALTIPAAVIYFQSFGGISAWISLLLTCFTGPVFPVAAATAASALLAAGGRLTGKRTVFEMGAMLATIILAVIIQMSFSRAIISGGDFSSIASILTDYTDILKKVFFAAGWQAEGFRAGGYAGTAAGFMFTVFSALLIMLFIRLINPELNEVSEKVSKNKKRSSAEGKIRIEAQPLMISLLKREWMVVRSNSAFLIETVSEVIILPILLIIAYFASPGDLHSIIAEFSASVSFLPLAVLGILILMSLINSVSCTSISREGRSFTVSKILPVSGRDQVKAKMLFHMILFSASWYLNLIILMLFLNIPAIHLLYLIPSGPAVVCLGFIISLNIDLSRPVLNWTHPQQAMKQNMNVPISMGLNILAAVIVIIPAVLLQLAGINVVVSGLLSTVLAVTADVVLLPKLMTYSDTRYIEISV